MFDFWDIDRKKEEIFTFFGVFVYWKTGFLTFVGQNDDHPGAGNEIIKSKKKKFCGNCHFETNYGTFAVVYFNVQCLQMDYCKYLVFHDISKHKTFEFCHLAFLNALIWGFVHGFNQKLQGCCFFVF